MESPTEVIKDLLKIGHYVPAVAKRVVYGNANPNNPTIPLKGIGIGNGWVDPISQYAAYGIFAYQHGFIDISTYASLNQTAAQCADAIQAQNWDNAAATCDTILPTALQNEGDINVYNYKLPCSPPPLCYDLSNITNYMNVTKFLSLSR